ncbi:hypothetical protein [Paraburkholderia sp. J94]|uniref:hypothetical protein n=1 Tax=Paraburkholderia sp. J94 TaxID=2805441 RepID=UPI002AB0A32F|nr:hypothetical protein [Paraburkholderia sp. J94]
MGFLDTFNLFVPICVKALFFGGVVGIVWYLICEHMDWGWKVLVGGLIVGALLCVSPQLWDLIQLSRDDVDAFVDLRSQQLTPDTLWSLIKAKLVCYTIGVVLGSAGGSKFSGAW